MISLVPLLKRPTMVYVLRDAGGAVLYVGLSVDPSRRLEAHRRLTMWGKLIAQVECEQFSDRATARVREAELIAEYRPPHNIHCNPDARGEALVLRTFHVDHEKWSRFGEVMQARNSNRSEALRCLIDRALEQGEAA